MWRGAAVILVSAAAAAASQACATQYDAKWCASHWNDDRIARSECDQFRSKFNADLPPLTVSVDQLARLRPMTLAETQSICVPLDPANPDYVAPDEPRNCGPLEPKMADQPHGFDHNQSLAPKAVHNQRLAMRADIAFGNLPIMRVRIGLVSADNGAISVNTAMRDGHREVLTAPLSRTEISTLVTALDRSHFWQLPPNPSHMGGADGKMAAIEVSIPGHRNRVLDFVGRPGAVDLSVLANAITTIVFAHWKGI